MLARIYLTSDREDDGWGVNHRNFGVDLIVSETELMRRGPRILKARGNGPRWRRAKTLVYPAVAADEYTLAGQVGKRQASRQTSPPTV